MEFAQVRYFLALYEELNFTRAAKRCGVSQPSLTNGIKNLERHVGGKLFYRIASSQSRTRPTELAIALAPHLKRMIESANLVRETAERFLANQNTSGHPGGSSLIIKTNPDFPGPLADIRCLRAERAIWEEES